MTQFLQRDSPIPRFFAYPKFLLTLELSETAKMICMLLLDRARLSMTKEDWQDDQGAGFHSLYDPVSGIIDRQE